MNLLDCHSVESTLSQSKAQWKKSSEKKSHMEISHMGFPDSYAIVKYNEEEKEAV
jgi:hypothetical protein